MTISSMTSVLLSLQFLDSIDPFPLITIGLLVFGKLEWGKLDVVLIRFPDEIANGLPK